MVTEVEDVGGGVRSGAAMDGSGGFDPERKTSGGAGAFLPIPCAVFLESGDGYDEEKPSGEAADNDQRTGWAAGDVESGEVGDG